MGISLTDRTHLLDGRTPEQVFREVIDACSSNDENTDIVLVIQYLSLSCCLYSQWLSLDGRLEESWLIIEKAKQYLRSVPSPLPYVELWVKECEALAYKALWELSKTPSPLVKCVRKIEEAAVLAESLNLYHKAQSLRELQPS
jgi:hypothetical protein